MAPRGLAILLGAGPALGAGIARTLASPSQGNLAVALLARNPENLSNLTTSLRNSSSGGVLESFPTDVADPSRLSQTLRDIRNHPTFKDLKLVIAVYNVKHSHKIPFLEETPEKFGESIQTYVRGAMVFGQECARWMLDQYPSSSDSKDQQQPLQKKGTIIFTGTLGALRTNAGYAAYGASRSSVRMLAQSMARELTFEGVHVVHTVVNGGVKDIPEAAEGKGKNMGGEDEETALKIAQGKAIRAESIGKQYLWLSGQPVDCWIHELDLRPAAEKF